MKDKENKPQVSKILQLKNTVSKSSVKKSVFEKYNLKDVWWGSLAGTYLANIMPPIVVFDSVE